MTARTVSTEDALSTVIAMHRLLRNLRRASDTSAVHPTQLIVLALLNQHGAQRIGELAKRVPCSQPTATTAVAGLAAIGFVDRAPDPTDGRAIQVVVTTAGRAALQSVARGEAEVLTELLATLSDDDLRLFLAATPVIGALADSHPAAEGRVPDLV